MSTDASVGRDAAISRALVLSVVAIAGAGTMTVELSAVRLLAPWFGTSSGVWTNVIGVILIALALGYLLGGRLACGSRPLRWLALTLIVAAACTVWLPRCAHPVAGYFRPQDVALDQAAGLVVWGSLAASLVLFLPAALALGCVGPLAVEVVQKAKGGHAGDAGGRVLAASTAGSLVGTFGTTHVFIPVLGFTRTFLFAALALALAGVFLLWRDRRARLLALPLLAILAGGSLLARFEEPEVNEGWTLLAASQSKYQSLRVVEGESQSGDALRFLQVNEAFDSFQSVWQPAAGLLPDGYYYNLFTLPPAWTAEADWRVLVLGLGAGTAVRVLEGSLPASVALDTTGVEIDPTVIELGERYFELQESGPGRRAIGGLDARAALRLAAEPYDEIIVDTYANNMEIPAHLATVEFFGEARERLASGGWLVVNAAGFGLDDPVVMAVAHTFATGFGAPVLGVRVPFSRNCVLFARRDAELPQPGTPAWRRTIAGVGEDGRLADLLAKLELPGAYRVFESQERALADGDLAHPVLTDDLNPIDRLQLQSIRAGRARWVPN